MFNWQLTALFVVIPSWQEMLSVETIATSRVCIGDVPIKIVIYNSRFFFACGFPRQFAMRYYKIPVFLHNLKNYDSHLIIERANELSERARIDVIAQNSEKFITFAFKNMCFKDSVSFLSSSLDKLVKLSKY